MLNPENTAVVEIINEEILSMLSTSGSDIETINMDDTITDHLGLTSLDLAQLVAMLEIRLSADPFASHTSITSVRTVGDLSDAYNTFLNQTDEATEPTPSAAVQQALQRASGRRR